MDSYDFSNVVDVLVLQMKHVVIILDPKSSQPNSKPYQRQEMEDEQDLSTNFSVIELDILDKKIRRLVCKLQKVLTVFYFKILVVCLSRTHVLVFYQTRRMFQHNKELEIFSHEDVEYGGVLGRGGEGVVRKCTVVYNGVRVEAAAKAVSDNSEDGLAITLDEIELLWLVALE